MPHPTLYAPEGDNVKDYQLAAKLLAQVQRAGARHNTTDRVLVQQLHDIAMELGAECYHEPADDLYAPHPQLMAAIKAAVKRDYKKEYRDYQGKPEQIKRRSGRNQARRIMEKAGKVTAGDKMDVDHLDRDTSNNDPSNLRVTSQSKNRSRKQG